MRLAFTFLLASTIICLAQTDPVARVNRARAFRLETIPVVDFDRTPLKNALGIIRDEWEKRHPQDPFPVGLTETANADGKIWEGLCTLKMTNVPYVDVVRYLAIQCGKALVEKDGFYALRDNFSTDGDWCIEDYPVSSKALAALSLTKASSPTDFYRALNVLGIKPPPIRAGEQSQFAMVWAQDQNRLVVRTTPSQQNEVRGILAILNHGYKLTKPTSPDDNK